MYCCFLALLCTLQVFSELHLQIFTGNNTVRDDYNYNYNYCYYYYYNHYNCDNCNYMTIPQQHAFLSYLFCYKELTFIHLFK